MTTSRKLEDVNFKLVQTIADQQMSENRLNLQLDRLKLMYEFVVALNAAQTINEIYQVALNGICPALSTSRAALVSKDDQGCMHYLASIGISDNYQQRIKYFFKNNPLVFQEMLLMPFPSCATLPSDLVLKGVFFDENIGALAIFPLDYEDRHLGDIVAYFESPRQFTEEEIQLAQTIVTYIAIALTRKQAENALKESQQFIQRIADTTPSILYIYDIEEQRNVYCNQTITSILGYTPEQIQAMGKSLLQKVIHPEDLLRIKHYYESIYSNQFDELFMIEYRMTDVHGNCKWFYSQETVFLRNPDRTVKQTLGNASDITQLKEVEMCLQSSLVEKEFLLREVHHRVKNNLSIIDSLLSMQARYISDAESLKLLSDSQQRIHTMSLIHEQLYQSQDMGKVDFYEYLQRLASNLYSSINAYKNQIELRLDIHPILLNIDIAISLGLIINELLTNSFKHAFPNLKEGLIEVTFQRSSVDQKLHLIIQDDGIGIPNDIDFHSTNSLGLRLVRILTQQLRASLQVSSTSGTSFYFTFQEEI